MTQYDPEKDHPQTIKGEPDARPLDMEQPESQDRENAEKLEEAAEALEESRERTRP